MSKYTTELRFICETNAGLVESEGYNSINDILERCRENIFNFDFPIFDEAYRPVIEKKILKHYYTREIATETVGLWKHYLDMRLNEIMPYYNKLYETELLHFNPFYDVDLFTEANKKGLHSGSENGTSNTSTHETNNTNTIAKSTANETGTEDGIGSKTNETFGTGSEDNITNEKGAIYRDGTDYGVTSVKGKEKTNQTGSGTSNTTKDTESTDGGSDTTSTEKDTTSTDGGSDTTSTTNTNKNTRYDLYSDTPQGSLSGVENENYLTNARKIIDDGTGSTGSSTTNYGKTTHSNEQSDTTTTYGKTNSTNEETDTTTNYTDETNTDRTEDSTSTLTKHSSDVTNNDKSNKTTFSNNTLGSEHSTAQKEHNVTNETNSEGETTSSTDGTADNTTTKNSTLNTTEDYIKHVYGKTPGFSYSKLLQEFRETFLNIDMLIINELSDLFFGLW